MKKQNLRFILISLCLLSLLISQNSCTKEDVSDINSQSTVIEKEDYLYKVDNFLRSKSDALQEAEAIIQFYNQDLKTKSSNREIASVISLVNSNYKRSLQSSDTLAYIINFSDNSGYVVVAANVNSPVTILATSPIGNIDVNDTDNSAPALNVFFANAQNLVDIESEYVADFDHKISKYYGPWSVEYVKEPLVKVKWGQRSPYNDNAPIINGERALAGCVATAVAQVMSYHKYPYNTPFKFNWNEMTKHTYPQTDIAKLEVARLFRQIGDNVKMNWGVDASEAKMSNVMNHFAMMGYDSPGSYGAYKLENVIYDLNLSIPVIISGYAKTYKYKEWFLGPYKTGYKEGHAWIIDGYLTRERLVVEYLEDGTTYSYKERENLVHCNFGWNGASDGYYNSKAFNTNEGPVTRNEESYNYQFNIETITNIKPR